MRDSRVAFETALMQRAQPVSRASAEGQPDVPPVQNTECAPFRIFECAPTLRRAAMYLAQQVGPALTRALAECVLNRPEDAIDYVANWLLQNKQSLQ